MPRPLLPFFLLLALAPPAPAQEVRFNRDIRPILSNKCFFCHGPDEKKREADLRLDLREGALADLGGYAAVVPGRPDESELLARVAHPDPEELVPPSASYPGLNGTTLEHASNGLPQCPSVDIYGALCCPAFAIKDG